MQANKISKQAINFQKMTFENWYKAMTLVQDQAVSTMDKVLDQATWIPEDGRNAIQKMVGAIQDERDRFKSYVDDSFITIEKALAPKPAAKVKKAAN
ncbi:MAG: hypothetical protein QNJ61_04850 [Desulfobacterales bacterium]|nr:hypothetical protein [Desulfobacterales bacterium]